MQWERSGSDPGQRGVYEAYWDGGGMTKSKRDELRNLARNATQGQWQLDKHFNPHDITLCVDKDFVANLCEINDDAGRYSLAFDVRRVVDAEYMVTANPQAVTALLDLVDRYELSLEKIKAHGCCVMHSDSGCPGCTATDSLSDGTQPPRSSVNI